MPAAPTRSTAAATGSALKIDLRDGRFTSLGQKDNFAIAYGAVIENATGGSGSDKLTGNKWANVLSGGAGNDRLDGGKGSDLLTGGPGSMRSVFNAGSGSGRDSIADFDPAADAIWLSRKVFAGIGGKGALEADAFHAGDGAHDAERPHRLRRRCRPPHPRQERQRSRQGQGVRHDRSRPRPRRRRRSS